MGAPIVLPVMLGMGAPVPLLSLIGLAGVLVLKSSDPAEWLRTVGGPTYAIISLAFVTAANFGTTTAGIYASAIGLRNFAAFAAALLDDAVADHDHAGRAGRHLHPRTVLRQIRQFSRPDRRRVRAAVRHSDHRLFRSAPPPHRHPRDLRGSARRGPIFFGEASTRPRCSPSPQAAAPISCCSIP